MSLEEVWPKADFITIHVPLLPETKGMFNTETFAKCKKGVRIINCARGGIIDEADLVKAINNGQVAAAGLDVFEQEPPTYKELVEHPKIVTTPHLGASTVEAQIKVAQEVAEQFVDATKNKPSKGVINPAALKA